MSTVIASSIVIGLLRLEPLEHFEPLELIIPVYIFICLIIARVSGLLSSSNFSAIV